jgi:hexosaminidase
VDLRSKHCKAHRFINLTIDFNFLTFAPLAIGLSHPEFLSLCHGKERSEPLDVTNTAVFNFVHDLYSEITLLFTDSWIHVGGDEGRFIVIIMYVTEKSQNLNFQRLVSLDCWKNASAIQKWMALHNMTNEIEILQFFAVDLLNHVIQSDGKRPIVWQDLFDSGVQGLPNNTIIDIWKEWIMEESLFNATNATFDVVFSACWYLDHLNQDWWAFYTCNPRNLANLSAVQQAHIFGGHTSMWGESVDISNFFERVWPRSSAAAEVLWSGSPKTFTKDLSYVHVQERLARFRCYMIQQFGVSVSPIAPGHCQSHGPIVSGNQNNVTQTTSALVLDATQ